MFTTMRTRRPLLLRVLAFVFALAAWSAMRSSSAQAPSSGPVLTVQVDRPGARISPLLYGIFFEEINHAGDGGLFAELVRNRSFEDAPQPQGWSLITRGGAHGTIAVDTSRPLNEAHKQSLRLQIADAASGEVAASNEGFWGIPVQKGASYRLSLYARRDRQFDGTLFVRLEDAKGTVLGSEQLNGIAPDWGRFECTLKASAAEPAARLVIAGAAPGTVWLDACSLFPADTWKGRKMGLRPDLAELVREIGPGFVRFPGGCFCEGDRLANAFRWKTTVGPPEQRAGHWNLWGYRSTNGLGYHEYLQWCEDLGAEPLFVINCGMAHQDHVPLDRMDEWVQDALDAVEYANGPTSSKWGALRAKNGHAKPFNMKYLGIGNENGWGNTLAAYEARYALFHDALKKRYPDLQLIATTPIRGRPMDVIDEHYYQTPEWFVQQSRKYDTYDRKGPKVYVGEYAVTQGCGLGNLRAALGEAAFMTGMERNADIVTMSSYAPLFVNVRDRKWNPDAICFDGTRSYGTPSYWVQRMFARNRGDVVLPLEISGNESPPNALPGAVGLGTWRTQAEFKEATVTSGGRTLLSSDFQQDAPGWRVFRGDWKVQDGAYRQSATGEDMRSIAGDPAWTDYTFSVKARKLSGAEGFLVMFRVRDNGNWYWWNVGGWNNTRHAIEKAVGGAKSIVGNDAPGRIETGRWYDLRVELEGARIRCYLDGKLVHDAEDRGLPALTAVASRADRGGDVILKVVNFGPVPKSTKVRLQGAGRVRSTAQATVLTSARSEDENYLEQPLRVSPKTRTLTGVGAEFEHAFPPYSVTVLRLTQRR